MRADQPKIKKELRDLKAAIKLLQVKIEDRDNAINALAYRIKTMEQDALIDRIEYKRLLDKKPALTLSYFIARVFTKNYRS